MIDSPRPYFLAPGTGKKRWGETHDRVNGVIRALRPMQVYITIAKR